MGDIQEVEKSEEGTVSAMRSLLRNWFEKPLFWIVLFLVLLASSGLGFLVTRGGLGKTEPAPAPETAVTEGISTYESKANGFSVEYPSSLVLDSGRGEVSHLPPNTVVLGDRSGTPQIVILSFSLSEPSAYYNETFGFLGRKFLGLVKGVLAATDSDKVRIALSLEEEPSNITTSRDVELYIGTLHDGFPSFTQMRISEDSDFRDVAWVPFSAIVTWKFSPGDGEKEVFGEFKDSEGNVYEGYGKFILDTTPPTGSIFIPRPSIGPDTLTLPIELSASDDATKVVEMRIGDTPELTDTLWVDYASTAEHPVPYVDDLRHGDLRAVYVQFKDAAGHKSSVISGHYYVDKEGPLLVVKEPGTGGPVRTVTVSAYDEFSDLDVMQISTDWQFSESAEVLKTMPYQTSFDWDFEKYPEVFVRVKDSVGNWSGNYVPISPEYEEHDEGSPAPLPPAETSPTASPSASESISEDTTPSSEGGKDEDEKLIRSAAFTEQVVQTYFSSWSKKKIDNQLVDGKAVTKAVYTRKEVSGESRDVLLTTFYTGDFAYVLVNLGGLSKESYQNMVDSFKLLTSGPEDHLPSL